MGMFSSIMSKIFGTVAGAPSKDAPAKGAPGTSPSTAGSSPSQTGSPIPAVDVAAALDGMAAKNPEKLDWKRSIVDLMKLVGMDSSLGARKELATELGYKGDQSDSAKMNIWLHKEVLRKLSENGGKVPPELLD